MGLRHYLDEHQRNWDFLGGCTNTKTIPRSTIWLQTHHLPWCLPDTNLAGWTLIAHSKSQQMVNNQLHLLFSKQGSFTALLWWEENRQKANRSSTSMKNAPRPPGSHKKLLQTWTVGLFWHPIISYYSHWWTGNWLEFKSIFAKAGPYRFLSAAI